jgi:predicted ATPase
MVGERHTNLVAVVPTEVFNSKNNNINNIGRMANVAKTRTASRTSAEWCDESIPLSVKSHTRRASSSSSSFRMTDASGELSRPLITSTLAPKARTVNDLSDFTIDKLKYASLGLHGRATELGLLKEILNKMMRTMSPTTAESSASSLSSGQERQLVLISGNSGTGKTALANHALQKSTEQLGGLFVRGKFDLNLRNHQPYAGISAACAEICHAIVTLQKTSPSQAQDLVRTLEIELGSELIALLIQVIPSLADVVTVLEEKAEGWGSTITSSSPTTVTAADSKHQINFAFLRFIRVVSYKFTPLVFVLDDLQWADGASIDLLEALLTDPTSTSKLLVVGIYRSNEVDETHVFHHTLQDLECKSQEKYFEMTQLEIGNLELDAVHTILQDLLGMDRTSSSSSSCDTTSRTWALADICRRRTLGNVFFLMQFVAMLKERRLLQFNFGIVSWTWNEKEIEASTMASDNVVDLLKAKMTELSEDLVDLLKLGSCLGSTFDVRTLRLVWEGSHATPSTHRAIGDNDSALMASVSRLEDEGYIVRNESQTSDHHHLQSFSWSHDKVQEAALSLVPEAEEGIFAARVGQILLSKLDEKELDSSIFAVVNLLNANVDGHIIMARETSQPSRLDLARLNLRASQKAILYSAFDSAAGYAAKGMELLSNINNPWADDLYQLTMDIHTVGAKAEGVLGNTEAMERYCKQVISQTDCPIEDKLDVYHTWIDSLFNRVLLDDATALSLEILARLKCKFPMSSAMIGLGVVSNVMHIQSTMKSRDVTKLVLLNDSTRIEVMKFLDRLTTLLYVTKDKRLPLVIFKSLNWTMTYGYCDYSPVAFATTALILTGVLNDLPGGLKYGEHALTLLERTKSQITAARTMFIVYGFTFTFTRPLRSLLKPLLRAYDIGLQTG